MGYTGDSWEKREVVDMALWTINLKPIWKEMAHMWVNLRIMQPEYPQVWDQWGRGA